MRSDVHMNGRQSSISGFFEPTIDNAASKDLTGTTRTNADERYKAPTPRFTLCSTSFGPRPFAAESRQGVYTQQNLALLAGRRVIAFAAL